jgi:hypothetical protein
MNFFSGFDGKFASGGLNIEIEVQSKIPHDRYAQLLDLG